MKKITSLALLLMTIVLFTFYSPFEEAAAVDAPSIEIDSQEEQQSFEVTNILLLGIDSGREKYEAVRSDTIMILSIDKENQKLKLSSIMRDTYVEVEGKGWLKLNEAYAYGGPELALKSVNENFNLNIESYVVVDFVGLSNIIDALGGIDLEIKDREINEINKYMKEVAEIKKEKPTPLLTGGVQSLNGNQAVAYARIRQVGEGDFERSERQSNVMSSLFNKLQNQEAAQYPSIAVKLLPYVKTNLSVLKMIETTLDIYRLKDLTLDWYRFPLYGYCQGEIIDRKWVLTTDLEVTTDHLYQFIYKDIKVKPLKDSF